VFDVIEGTLRCSCYQSLFIKFNLKGLSMKKISMTLAAMFAASSVAAVAAPMQMTDAEMEKIVAGADYDVYINKGGQYAIKLAGDPNPSNRGQMTPVDSISCSDDGGGSCSFGGKDFSWNETKMRWN
jgi:hypothetical protein